MVRTSCRPRNHSFPELFLDLPGAMRRIPRRGCRWGGGHWSPPLPFGGFAQVWWQGPFLSILPGHTDDVQRGAPFPAGGFRGFAWPPEAAFPEPADSPEPVLAGHMGVTAHHQPAGLNVVENPAATFPQLHSRPLRK